MTSKTHLTDALMALAARNSGPRVLVGSDETIVIRVRDVPVISAWQPPNAQDTSGDAWRRKGKRRGRHAR